MTTHELKTWPEPFAAVVDGRKTFDIRRADREFSVGDRLRLLEWDPAEWDTTAASSSGLSHQRGYTGRECSVEVTYLSAPGRWGLPDDLCVMSIRKVESTECVHTATERGKDYQLRHGSHCTEVCLDCGAWRTHGHDAARSNMSGWRPASEYEEATAPQEDES